MLLFAMLAAMIGLQLVDYLTRKPDPKSEVARYQDEFRRAILQSDAVRSAPKSGSEEGNQNRAALDELVEELAKKRVGNAELTLIYVAAQHERKAKLEQRDLDLLRKQDSRAFKAAAEIYRSEALSPERAKLLAGDVESAGYSGRIAAAHALEKSGDTQARTRISTQVEKFVMALFGLGVLGGLLIGTTLLIAYWRAYRSKAAVPKGHPAGELVRADAERFALRAAQLMATPIFASLLVGLVFGSRNESPLVGALASTVTVVAALALSRLPVNGVAIPLARIGLKIGRFRTEALWGLGGLIANLPLLAIGAVVGLSVFRSLPEPEHPVNAVLQTTTSPWAIAAIFVSAVIAAPVFEEILFRGTLLPALSSLCKSPVWGVVLSSLIFAAVHPTGVPVWPVLATVGMACAVVTYQTGSLIPAIVLHALHNGAVLTLGLVGP